MFHLLVKLGVLMVEGSLVVRLREVIVPECSQLVLLLADLRPHRLLLALRLLN